MRIAGLATLTGAWIVSPSALAHVGAQLDVPQLDPAALFDDATLERNGRYRTSWPRCGRGSSLFSWPFSLLVRRRPQPPGPPVLGGALLGGAVFAALWLAELPFRLAAHWWRRRYDVSDLGLPPVPRRSVVDDPGGARAGLPRRGGARRSRTAARPAGVARHLGSPRRARRRLRRRVPARARAPSPPARGSCPRCADRALARARVWGRRPSRCARRGSALMRSTRRRSAPGRRLA